MSSSPTDKPAPAWRGNLPVLAGRLVALREPVPDDAGGLFDLLSVSDASTFGLPTPITESAVRALIERAVSDRAGGLALTYVVTLHATGAIAGLVQVRQLEPTFETAEWEVTLAPSARGTGAFLETGRLVGSFVFDAVGVRRLECRVTIQNGRANGALRKMGAVEEGVLRRSFRRGGQYLDQVLWSVLRDEWGEPRPPSGARVH
jgi:RimJ/RimL family protein N-acetyltransferase